ncbi:MAG: SusC/RagA family TonB-linked outer membrane protein [Chryseolinea sp.]
MIRIYNYTNQKTKPRRYHSFGFTLLGFLILALSGNHAMAKNQRHESVIELNVKDVPLKNVLREIERQTDYHFVVNDSRMKNVKKPITLNIKSESIVDVLNQLLLGTDITYKIKKRQITLVPSSSSNNQQSNLTSVLSSESSAMTALTQRAFSISSIPNPDIIVSGTVTEEDTGAPLPGVNILVKGTTLGTVTDANGNFSIAVPSGESILVFTFIGFIPQEVSLNGRTNLTVTLIGDLKTLSEVVVVGYGTQDKKDVTGSISSVKGQEFENLPVSSTQQALQGRTAGVNIVRSGGEPGNSGAIRIRGIGSVNDANPLIIIDGVPSDGPLIDVNPNDIESVEILKDASASAIYGTRAANGVVIVTTKRGKFGQGLKMSVNGYSGISNRIKSIDVLDAPTLAMLKRERYTNDGLTIDPIWQDPQYQTQKTDWQNEVLGQGTVNNLDLSISGGGEKSTFAISGGVYNEQGMIKNSYFKRYSFRINSDHKITDKFKVGQSLQITDQTGTVPNTLSAQDGLVWSAIRFHPGLPVKNDDGSYSSSQISPQFGDINNPIFTIDTQDKHQSRARILASINGDLEILKGLHAKANVAVDAGFYDYHEFNIRVLDQTRTTVNNSRTVSSSKSYSILQEYFVTYNKQLGKHDIGLVAGYSQQTFNYSDMGAQKKDLPSEEPSQRYLNAGGTITNAWEGRSYDALQSYFGRGTYSYNNKYLATFTFRADASSKFAPSNRWGYFPAFSLGWRVSEESFFKNLTNIFSNLKLTGGYGELGNSNIPRLQYLSLIGGGYRYSFGGNQTLGSAQSSIGNSNIAWERAVMTNFGLEAGLLENQVLVTLGYFNKQTKDMLLPPPSLGSNGTAAIPYQNVGQLENKGLEIEISYRKTIGDFSYTLSGNATYLTNKVTQLYNGNFLASQLYGRSSSEISRTFEGQPVATFYGWKTNGLYQNQLEIDNDINISEDPRRQNNQIQPGDVRFLDLNGDHIIDDKDRTIIGNPTPKLTYGINATAGYKGFDLSLFFLGAAKVDIYNADRMQGIDPTYSFNMYAETINRWHGEGTSNSIPRMTTARDNLNHRTSDMFVESGAFFRLKNTTLGYSLPNTMLQALHLSKARFYVTGQNIFVVTKYKGMDPELGIVQGNAQLNVDYAQYPQARTWTIGAQLSF